MAKQKKVFKLKSTGNPPVRNINKKRYVGWAGYSQITKAKAKKDRIKQEGNLAQVKKIGKYHWVLYHLKK